ncbi:MAG TPA: energy transducer TonB [Williamwhitmania sp.]|nr:energy transducer TonB [Williamwhitmania sp.]
MLPKKTNRANLENKKALFFEIGLVVTLAAALAGFEWSSTPSHSTITQVSMGQDPTDIIEIPITERKVIKTPPAPPRVIEVINITKNNSPAVTDENINWGGEDNPNTPSLLTNYEPTEEKLVEDPIVYIPSEFPTFMGGGTEKFVSWVMQRIHYPQIAQETDIEGTVYISFVVNKVGKVDKIKVVRGVDALLDNEALRVISSSPKWTPGKQGTRTVSVGFTIPVTFKLTN